MRKFFVSIGSNIDPERNIVVTLENLLKLTPRLDISRVFQTQPVGVPTLSPFLNCAVCVDCDFSLSLLKRHFNTIEVMLGRDRSDPQRKYKDRPADLDILFHMKSDQPTSKEIRIPGESYVRPMVLDLLGDSVCPEENPSTPVSSGIALKLGNLVVGDRPVSLRRMENGSLVDVPFLNHAKEGIL